jgi:16S rRNA processing protein RimM
MSDVPFRVASIDTTHGLRGEVSARLTTDFPDRFGALTRVHVGKSPEGDVMELESWRPHKGKVLLKLRGIDDVEAARGLVGSSVWVEAADAVPLPEDTYFHRDLVGLEVRTTAGRPLGTVSGVLVTGGVDVLQVADGDREILVPAARSICVDVDLASGVLVIEPPEGLLDL